MSSQQKRGFRLPWAADRAPDEGAAGAATLDPSLEPTNGMDGDDLGDGPFRLAGSPPTSTEDAVPAAPDQPEQTAEAAMIETTATEPTTAAAAQDGDGAPMTTTDGWPDSDRRGAPGHGTDAAALATRPAIHAAGEARPPRRENPLVAGLVKAMREAAVASRDETILRLMGEAETRIEGIRSRATSEAAELKRRADGDVADIREWSKAEVARIRQETDERIEARKSELTVETERHAASVERLVADVEAVVDRFQADMDQFFARLLAEDDPARLAALAEQAPDAPDLTGDGPAAIDMLDAADADDGEPAALEAEAAAAAEVAAGEGLDLETGAWPAAALAASPAAVPFAEPDGDAAPTRLQVSGLTSVAGISAFKGALGQLPGVDGVSVSTGERGVFVFTISHAPGIDLASGVASLPGFAARITDATDDGITVVAHEPAA